MEILNAPSRETFCTRRDRTDTPLQALVTLNDTQFMEAARRLADKAILSSTISIPDWTTSPNRLSLVRSIPKSAPSSAKWKEHFLSDYQKDPDDAKALLSVGESRGWIRDSSRRTCRVDTGCQRDSQPRRNTHQIGRMNLDPQIAPLINQLNASLTRRQFFRKSAAGLGVAALSSLLGPSVLEHRRATSVDDVWRIPAKAKRAIYISLIGAPSQLDPFDYKEGLRTRFKEDLKDWLKKQGERLTGMTSGQETFPLAPSIFKFSNTAPAGHGSANCSRGTPKWRAICVSSGPCIPTPSITSRPISYFTLAR